MLVWVDIETTGLEVERRRILEVAMVITNDYGDDILAETCWVVRPSDWREQFAAMDPVVHAMHEKSGLLDDVVQHGKMTPVVERELLTFLDEHGYVQGGSPLCGNSVHFDRAFLAKKMPMLEAFFHYRNFDISTLKEACKRLRPASSQFELPGDKPHRALQDVHASIEEFRFYKRTFLRVA